MNKTTLTFNRQTFPSGIDHWSVDAINDLPSFLKQLKGDSKSVLVANLGQKELAAPGLVFDSEDLFEKAPAHIRKENILKLADVDYSAKYLDEICIWLTNNCGLLVHSPHDAAALKEAKRVFWGWYSQPSILEHQVRVGSENLASKLFESIGAVIIVKKVSSSACSVTLLSPPASAQQIEQFLTK